jgi:hypothetical protein
MYRNMLSLLVLSGVCLTAGVAAGNGKATSPNPANGALSVSLPLLQWNKGDTAVLHDVYLGTTPELTTANLVASRQPPTVYYHVAGFQPGATYYWRVDEIATDGVTVYAGDVWQFTTQALTAYHPTPADAGTATSKMALSWLPGAGTVKHHLYFGASLDAVAQGAAGTDKGLLTETTFAPGTLDGKTTYYWRVDEVLVDGSVKTGPVWSFMTLLSLDDFESYTDKEGSSVFDAWVDGFTDKLSGSTVGKLTAANGTYCETMIVHGGGQSMPLDYNNVKTPFYSEAALAFASPQD